MADLTKLAAVFDAMADYVDARETEKTAVIENTRKARLDKIAMAHLASHGEPMSDVDRAKLAQANDAALDYIEDTLSKQASVVDSLGAGASPEADSQPTNVKEASVAADERFLSWVNS